MKKSIRLTDALIAKAIKGKADPYKLTDKHDVISDSDLNGLKIIRSGRDTVSFRFFYRIAGKRRNITLGSFPAINCVQARGLAKEKAVEVATGGDPIIGKQEARVDQQNTLRSYLEHDYSLHMKSKAIRAERYLAMVRDNFPLIIDKPLSEITKTDLVKWVQYQKQQHDNGVKGFASATIKQKYAALKTLMSHAVRNNVINQNPFERMERLEFSIDESTQQQSKRTFLSIEQQKALLHSIDNYGEGVTHHKPMLLILYYTGMRIGDVVGLEWGHLNDNHFACNISKVLEKTRRKIKAPTTIQMPLQVRDALREWRKTQGNPVTGLVFPNPSTGLRLSPQPLKRCWAWIKKDANLPEELELYSLRHNFASWLIMKNTPVSIVAAMLGHRTTDMIDKHYGHLIKGADSAASDTFAQLSQEL